MSNLDRSAPRTHQPSLFFASAVTDNLCRLVSGDGALSIPNGYMQLDAPVVGDIIMLPMPFLASKLEVIQVRPEFSNTLNAARHTVVYVKLLEYT